MTEIDIFDSIYKNVDKYGDYLKKTLECTKDFLGKDWVTSQIMIVQKKQHHNVSILFRRLYQNGFLKRSPNQVYFDTLAFGYNHIISMINANYLRHYANNHDNNRFFYTSKFSDFQGIWSELILLHYLHINGYKIEPCDDHAVKEKKTPDFRLDNERIDIEVKSFSDKKYHSNNMATFASHSPTHREKVDLLRRYRKALKKKASHRLIIIIDISLHWELFSKVIGSIMIQPNEFQNKFRAVTGYDTDSTLDENQLYFQLRDPCSELLFKLYRVL